MLDIKITDKKKFENVDYVEFSGRSIYKNAINGNVTIAFNNGDEIDITGQHSINDWNEEYGFIVVEKLSANTQRMIEKYGEKMCIEAVYKNEIDGDGGSTIGYAFGVSTNTADALCEAGRDLNNVNNKDAKEAFEAIK